MGWELHKDAACCFKQILEIASHKTAVVWSFASHLTNHLSKTNRMYWALLEKLEQTHKKSSPMGSHQCWLTSKD